LHRNVKDHEKRLPVWCWATDDYALDLLNRTNSKTFKPITKLYLSMQAKENFSDPKIAFTLGIIQEQEFIRYSLNSNNLGTAAKALAVMLLRLDIPKTDNEMLSLCESLTPVNYNLASNELVYSAYKMVSAFLNKTYFKDFKGYHGIDPDKMFDTKPGGGSS
jgi:hypothetical protein